VSGLVGTADRIQTDALLAVELVDPVTLALVAAKVTLRANGLTGAPRLGWSGRFVWLQEGDAWPTSFEFDPRGLPFDAQTITALPKPDDLASASAQQRLLRVVLRPTAAYPFGDGLTVVRASLRESDAVGAAPVPEAFARLLWKKGSSWIDDGAFAVSNAAGDFAAWLRLPTNAKPALDEQGRLLLQLRVTRSINGAEIEKKINLAANDGRLTDLPTAPAWSAMTST
jgi:hypothetical protein